MSMGNINIEGISFTETMLEELRVWLTPGELDPPQIEYNLMALDDIQSFLLSRWDKLDESDDKELKTLLMDIQIIKSRFKRLMPGKSGSNV